MKPHKKNELPATDATGISRYLSYVLRHAPQSIGLQLDPEGWAHVDELIIQLRGEKELQVASVVGNRADVERVPEGGTVLAVVQNVEADIGSLIDRGA